LRKCKEARKNMVDLEFYKNASNVLGHEWVSVLHYAKDNG
jgi:hypothetical protein